jgi:hypothetical protein
MITISVVISAAIAIVGNDNKVQKTVFSNFKVYGIGIVADFVCHNFF